MGNVKLKHYVVRKRRGYWLVTPREARDELSECALPPRRAGGVGNRPGMGGALAARAPRPGSGAGRGIPANSVGDAFERYKRTKA